MVAKRSTSGGDTSPLRSWIGRGSVVPLLCGLLLTGCSLLARAAGTFDDPSIALQMSKVESVSVHTTTLQFAFIVHNPNGFALRPRALRYVLSVNQTVVAEGSSDVGVTVPASASASVEVPIEVSRESLSNAAPDAVVLGEIPYDLDVRLFFDSWLREREVRFVASSVLRLNLPLGLARAGAVAFTAEGWQS